MRRLPAVILAALVFATGAHAADPGSYRTSSLPVLATPAPTFLSEIRLGASAQDPTGPESGSANLTSEIITVPLFTVDDPILNRLIPRVHLGGSFNLNGRTSFGYAGLTWTFDLTPRVFAEGSFGGAVHNGETDPIIPHRSALGCTALFRESGSLGFRINANWSVIATVEHLSNAGACSNNRGLTNIGVRVGYSF